MKKSIKKLLVILTILVFTISFAIPITGLAAKAQESKAVIIKGRQMEKIDRAPIAIKTDNGVYISWRLLGTDPIDISFNVYRDGLKINSEPITMSTNFIDPQGTLNSKYYITAVINGVEVERTQEISVLPHNYIEIPLQKPVNPYSPDYTPNDASVGDLDGDGQYEIVIKWEPVNAKDNSQSGVTGDVFLDAIKMDGTRLWRIDLGRNIRAGAHYTQFLVYDFDGDGKAELICKTADGTVDGQGNVIGDPNANYVNPSGYILDGPEYLTLFDGETGRALDTVPYDPPRGNVSDKNVWGDNYGNRVDRFLAAVAYLDGHHPSAIFSRGYYTKTYIVAWDVVNKKLVKRWRFDTGETNDGYRDEYEGQGNHNLSVADVDLDGKDEIIFGAMTVDDNGEPLYTTRLGHGDALHVGDFDPYRDGYEVFKVMESGAAGGALWDAATGTILQRFVRYKDTGRGVADDIDPRYPGAELWGPGPYTVSGVTYEGVGLRAIDGTVISLTYTPPMNFTIWWDGDLLREVLDSVYSRGQYDNPFIGKWDYNNLQTVTLLSVAGECYSNNDTKATPCLTADLFGDWREEAIWRTVNNKAIRIYISTMPTNYRFVTLMHDSMYRVAIAWQNVGYNQPPHPSYYIGEDMAPAGLEAEKVTGSDGSLKKVVLRWQPMPDAVYYEVYRSVYDPLNVGYPTFGFNNYIKIATVTTNKFVDTNVGNSVKYAYRIKVYRNGKLSAPSFPVVVVDEKAKEVSINRVNGTLRNVVINWDNIPDATYYEVYRSEYTATAGFGEFNKVGIVSENRFVDTTAEIGKYYMYKVVARGVNSYEYPPIYIFDFNGYKIKSDGVLERKAGLKASIGVEQTENVYCEGNKVVVFELFRGNTPISIVAVEKDIKDAENFIGYFNVDPTDSEYYVKIFVFDRFDSDLTVPYSLAEPQVLR